MIIHVVSRGETLWQLASRYKVNMNSIGQLNELPNAKQLAVGQSVVIPKPGTSHVIKSGETLWSIAQQYWVTINAIIQANQLTNPNLLYPGTSLFIPAITHVVQSGETLAYIARRYGTSIQAISRENQITNPNLITIGMQLVIPRKKPIIEVNAYTYQSDDAGAQTVNELGQLLTYFSPFAYKILEDGSLSPIKDTLMIEAARAKKAVPMMSLTNFTATHAGSNEAHVILSSPDIREKIITNIAQVMDSKGYKGINIDFENVLPGDRELYNQFLQQVVNALHPKGYFVSTALAPKTSATQSGLLYEAHDYAAHGRIADFVVLMTYEWGYRLGPPQAISPITEMRKVVEYALTVMPAEKIFLGFQIYARDWLLPHVKGQEAETFSPQEAVRRAVKFGAAIQYDPTTQSPFFRYTDEQGRGHEVWFEDARSAQAKFDLAKQYNLRGVSYWALGYPYPQNWALLKDNFSIKKLS
ncbi:LysM peptidoglycan-binding domain-containing protein [Neobacillus vireti]|uniref:Spore germination protein n=1 Tax=Neobacillus vireti LMG 21834 TaxID=1131730 RepID=A0AB94IHP0_9BACI|nr:LysM peptidoglycan-binding domain-containing protein [Neobacillus vireti]ETI66550.1 spore germination protein [Neobacillus vireti LMG 21834]KLT16539.1 spore gernimation protein [Neobacillus vireti]